MIGRPLDSQGIVNQDLGQVASGIDDPRMHARGHPSHSEAGLVLIRSDRYGS